MRVAVTGVSSYTGACIAAAFAAGGAEVFGICHRDATSYSGLAARRLGLAREAGAQLVGPLPAESPELLDWLRRQPLDLWIHHHHPMERFRAPDYDVPTAEKVALQPLPMLLDALAEAGIKGLILSSTYFEPGEGGQAPDSPYTPYAELKAAVTDELTRLCAQHRLPLGRVIIPSPTGALENSDRLTPLLLASARAQAPFLLRSPDSLMDMVPGETLAHEYVRLGHSVLAGQSVSVRPSGKVVSAEAWARGPASDIARRLGWEVRLEIPPPEERAKMVAFHNVDPVSPPVDWEAFAAAYARQFDWA